MLSVAVIVPPVVGLCRGSVPGPVLTRMCSVLSTRSGMYLIHIHMLYLVPLSTYGKKSDAITSGNKSLKNLKCKILRR
jgi:hypothetical protein